MSEYTYLGIVMSTCLSSICIQNRLATRARSAVAKIDKSFRHLSGDTGSHKLYIRSTVCSISYRQKILKINDFRYVKKVYNMMLNRSIANSWTNQIKDVLNNLNLSVEEESHFLYIVESELTEISDNKWSACIASSARHCRSHATKMIDFKSDCY